MLLLSFVVVFLLGTTTFDQLGMDKSKELGTSDSFPAAVECTVARHILFTPHGHMAT